MLAEGASCADPMEAVFGEAEMAMVGVPKMAEEGDDGQRKGQEGVGEGREVGAVQEPKVGEPETTGAEERESKDQVEQQ